MVEFRPAKEEENPMLQTRTMRLMSAILVLASLQAQHTMASTLEVGTCSSNDSEDVSAHFPTIQAAVNAASSGSTVLVCPGTYPEQVDIARPLTLRGVRSGNMAAAVVISPPTGLIVPPSGITTTAPQIFVHDTSGPVTVSNLTVDGSNNQVASCTTPTFVVGVYFRSASGRMENIVARNQNVSVGGSPCGSGIGLRATGDLGATTVTIENNTVSAYDFSGIFASYPLAKVTIRNNSAVGQRGTAGIILFFDVVGTVSENSLVDNTDSTVGGSGIDVVGVHNAVISGNHLGRNGYGIAFYSFQGDPNSDNGTITDNDVFGSDGDGITVCGDNNMVRGNTIAGNTESGVNLVSGPNFGTQCTANNNRVTDNTINGACAGILLDPSTTGNAVRSDNTILNAANVQLTGISCPLPPAASMAKAAQSVRRSTPMVVRPGN
jgi:parallel beta-helix repeat protein